MPIRIIKTHHLLRPRLLANFMNEFHTGFVELLVNCVDFIGLEIQLAVMSSLRYGVLGCLTSKLW